ncbi:MAG: hypothetical protein V3V35_10615 [Dehalococcoidia bacterium]
MEDNRHGISVGVRLTEATGTAERETAIEMLEGIPGWRQVTVDADNAYDTREFVEACRLMGVTPPAGQSVPAVLTFHLT